MPTGMDLGDPKLKPIKVLGAGSFGRVFLCKYRNNHNVCVKRIIVQNPKTELGIIMEEVYIISQLRHPNIVKFIDSYIHAGTINIIMEHAPNGTLQDLIVQSLPEGLGNNNILRYFCDALMGLEYLHIRHVLHRDLKPANLLVDANSHLVIADFGISHVQSANNNLCAMGTPYYLAPELLRGEKYDYKSDIWSLGCILYEMCMGHNPFSQAGTLDELRYLIRVMTRNTKLDCSSIYWRNGSMWANLCERMVVNNVQQRIALPDILCLHPALTTSYYNKYFDYKYNV